MELEPDKHVSRTYVAPAVALAEQWHASDPSPESSYWLAISNEMKGFMLGLAADPDGAIAAFQRARTILGQLVHDLPDDNRFERELWITGAVVSMYSAGIGGAEMWKPDTGDLATAESSDARSGRRFRGARQSAIPRMRARPPTPPPSPARSARSSRCVT